MSRMQFSDQGWCGEGKTKTKTIALLHGVGGTQETNWSNTSRHQALQAWLRVPVIARAPLVTGGSSPLGTDPKALGTSTFRNTFRVDPNSVSPEVVLLGMSLWCQRGIDRFLPPCCSCSVSEWSSGMPSLSPVSRTDTCLLFALLRQRDWAQRSRGSLDCQLALCFFDCSPRLHYISFHCQPHHPEDLCSTVYLLVFPGVLLLSPIFPPVPVHRRHNMAPSAVWGHQAAWLQSLALLLPGCASHRICLSMSSSVTLGQ